MKLHQLNYFVALARLEHYTKAAEEIGISQPTLSHAIAGLEEELGVKLFRKQGRNVVLTKYGRFFLGYVEESMNVLELGVSKTKGMAGQTKGVIDLAYIYTLGSEFVPRLVGDFLRSHEELETEFHFTVGNTSELIQGLKDEKYDIAFCSMMENEPEVSFTPVGIQNLVVVIPKQHPLSGRGEVDLEEAALYPQIYFTQGSGLRPVVDRLFEMAKIRPQIAYEIEEDGAMAGLVAQNFGIAVMPDIPLLKNMNVEVLKLRSPRYQRYIYMALSKENYQTPIVEKFAEYVKALYGKY
nr:LysR family transcriptional regulator [uncultured Blautia sp.]